MRNQSVLWAACGAVVGGLGLLGGLGFVGGLGRAEHGGYYSSAMLWAAETPGQAPSTEPKPESPAPTETKKLLPQPTLEEIRRAEKAVDEVFGRDAAKAKTAAEKAKVAGEILKTAREEKDQAVRFVLAQRAKQLAIQAQNAKLVVQAAEILAEFEPPSGSISAKAAADKAHGLWAKGEFAKGAPRLSYWTDAAELYLRALDNLEGFEKTIAERRLKELGWLGHFLPPEKVVEMFKIPNATINGEEIVWDSQREWLMATVPGRCPVEFGFEINAVQNHVIRIYFNEKGYSFVRGPQGRAESWRHTDFHGPYRPILLDRIGVQPGWHSMKLVAHNGKVYIYYDEQLVDTIEQPASGPNPIIKVGFGDHQCKVSIRRVFYSVNEAKASASDN